MHENPLKALHLEEMFFSQMICNLWKAFASLKLPRKAYPLYNFYVMNMNLKRTLIL